MIKIVFFGTNIESMPALHTLFLDTRISISSIVTAEPKPIGRKQKLIDGPVLEFAKENNIPVLFDSDSNLIARLREHQTDLQIVVSYGRILKQDVLTIPRFGSINVHPSLLPRFRGPAPVPFTILAGEDKTGVTIIQMDEKMDHGQILAMEQITLHGDENTPELLMRLMKLGAEMLLDVIANTVSGKQIATEQNHNDATFSKMLTRDDGRLPIRESPIVWERMVRALNPWPGVWCEVLQNDKPTRIKIHDAHLSGTGDTSDTIREIDGKIHIGSFILDTIQFEGAKITSGITFAKTHKSYSALIVE